MHPMIKAMPTMIIVKGKTSLSLRSHNEGPAGVLRGFQKKALMSDELGCSWFQEVFLKNGEKHALNANHANHRSHGTIGLLEAAAENNIVLLTFLPHSTYYLCPLDRSLFGPFQRIYNGIRSEYMTSKTTSNVPRYYESGIFSAFLQNKYSL